MEKPQANKQETKELVDKPKESVSAEDVAQKQAKMTEEKLQLAEDSRVQTQMDAEKATELLKLIKGEAPTADAGSSELAANAERVAAEKAAALAKSIEDGTYEWDGNVSQAENMKRMRAAEAGVARRNASFRKAA